MSKRSFTMSDRQVNLWLGVAVCATMVTGLVSWTIGSGWARWWTVVHGTFGMMILVLAPAKVKGSVRVGLRRNRATRTVSVIFGVLVLAVVGLGLAHSTGAWVGVGYWSPLWTHVLLAFVAAPLLIWHVLSRPLRPRRVDLDRRLVIGGGATGAIALGLVAAVEGFGNIFDTRGGARRFTGSHEIGSFDPDRMPSVSWIDDTAPRVVREDWSVSIAGESVGVDRLAGRTDALVATVDCTGGWFSTQRWDAVAVADLLPAGSDTRSFRVASSTGYSRIFPMRDADNTYLATGYGGRRLRQGHGAPVRLVAPGRRGPWWVKWVVEIEPTNRPWWLQLPLPPT